VRIPFHDVASELELVRADVDAAIARVLDSGVVIGGPEVSAFESLLAASVGVKHAIGTSSGTDALHVAYMALGVCPGDEIVTSPFTFFATAGSAARLGARIVFADIDDSTLVLDARAAATACSDLTRAVVPVHLFGQLAEIPVVPCAIIEDGAQSLGAGPPRGLAATLSFFPTKTIGALGDAGAVVSDDATFADRVALLRTQGARPKYHHVAVGGNFRLDAIQAAVLAAKLPRLSSWIAARRQIADRYRKELAATVPQLRLPPQREVYSQYVVRAPRRDDLRAHLARHGIGTEVYYPEPLHLQPAFADLGYRRGSFPNAEQACQDALALPLYPSLSPDACGAIVDSITQFYR
jgi:dTDP-4-amino-4,6-dideoxygalactose transaminase